MSDINNSLLVKFGLERIPSEDNVRLWVAKTRSYMEMGFASEEAGRKAAKEIFSDFGRMKYAAQSDTILALLAQAGNK